ncbi:hypothetical protein [Thalassomonas sp. RHCl1]|uniref:hypothetical protein n=1 Tax=Thalassomonas sp. RHCl1 TaxID=2995320 RepID=UPI00248B1EAF|nr:hypothetical protein [Thalassomonas sp. RHCl1]
MTVIKKYLLLISTLLFTNLSYAAGKITYLNVVDDTVYFTTDEAKASTPGCVVTENAQQWTVSLNNKTGRALYSLLVTAMAGKQAINVETGADCGDITGIERAKGISLQPATETASTSANGKALYLFQGDGVTKVGRIAEVLSPTTFYYLPVGNEEQFAFYDSGARFEEGYMYFDGPDCSGNVAGNKNFLEKIFRNKHYNDGRLYQAGSLLNFPMQSYLLSDGTCQANVTTGIYMTIKEYTDPLCGDYACVIKED